MASKKSIKELFTLLEESINVELTNDERYKEAICRRNTKSELIETCFSKDEFDILQEYLEIKNEIESIQMEKAFESGFSIAFQLILDSLR